MKRFHSSRNCSNQLDVFKQAQLREKINSEGAFSSRRLWGRGGREEAAASVVGAVSRTLILTDALRGTAGSYVSVSTGGRGGAAA